MIDCTCCLQDQQSPTSSQLAAEVAAYEACLLQHNHLILQARSELF